VRWQFRRAHGWLFAIICVPGQSVDRVAHFIAARCRPQLWRLFRAVQENPTTARPVCSGLRVCAATHAGEQAACSVNPLVSAHLKHHNRYLWRSWLQ
jgi:hypothetical protein